MTIHSEHHNEDRRSAAEFATSFSREEFRVREDELHGSWHNLNKTWFANQMEVPHIVIGRTASRSLGHCDAATGNGGSQEIGLNGGLVFGTNTAWVVHPWPTAAGTWRFVGDLLLRFTVRQYVLEKLHTDEHGYRGFGPLFVEEANRIGRALGLAPVTARRRRLDNGSPVANGWPHGVRPANYYGLDVTEEALVRAGGCAGERRRSQTTPNQGLLELLQFLFQAGPSDRCQRLVERHLDRGRTWQGLPLPRRRGVEAGLEDTDGSPLGEVKRSPDWLAWNDGTVRQMAASVQQFGSYGDLPILADALEQAGCSDGRILRHLRERMEHGRCCWVLHLLLAPETG